MRVSDAQLTAALAAYYGENFHPCGDTEAVTVEDIARTLYADDELWPHAYDNYVSLKSQPWPKTEVADNSVVGKCLARAYNVLALLEKKGMKS